MDKKNIPLLYGIFGITGIIVVCIVGAIVVVFVGGSLAFQSNDGSEKVCYYHYDEEEALKNFSKNGLNKDQAITFIGNVMELQSDPSLVFAFLKYQKKPYTETNIKNLVEKFKGSNDAAALIYDLAPDKKSKEGIISKDYDFITGVQKIYIELKPMLVCSSEEDAKNGIIPEFDGELIIGDGLFSKPLNRDLYITSHYGYRIHPITKEAHLHRGTDFRCTKGEAILSVMPGVIHTATYHYSWGNYVLVDHKNGVYTLYAHMTDILSSVGQSVVGGQVIGTCGTTGSSTAPHLHLEVHLNKAYGQLTNPITYFNFQ